MEGESGVTRSISDELHTSVIEGDQMESESCLTRSIIDELHSSDVQREQMRGEDGVTPSIIDELHSSDMIKWKTEVVLLEVSLMNTILRLSGEMK